MPSGHLDGWLDGWDGREEGWPYAVFVSGLMLFRGCGPYRMIFEHYVLSLSAQADYHYILRDIDCVGGNLELAPITVEEGENGERTSG